LEKHGNLEEQTYFIIDGPKDLADAVKAINSNKIALTYFLCEKIAASTNSGATMYDDLILFEHVAGIDLQWADDKPFVAEEFEGNMNRFVATFREEWRAGIYKDPSKQVAQLCEKRLSKENGGNINSLDLIAIRRYGIFGLPELVRQIKQHNSKHAFAAYLVIVHEHEQYSDYLEHSDQQFTNVVDKISHVKKKVHEMDANAGGDFDVMKKISSALAEN